MDLAITVIVVALSLLLEHWAPWQKIFQRRFHVVVNYMLGVLALIVPLTVLYWTWGSLREIVALWSVVVAGGLTVMLAYAVDDWAEARLARREAEEREQELLLHDQDDRCS